MEVMETVDYGEMGAKMDLKLLIYCILFLFVFGCKTVVDNEKQTFEKAFSFEVKDTISWISIYNSSDEITFFEREFENIVAKHKNAEQIIKEHHPMSTFYLFLLSKNRKLPYLDEFFTPRND